MPSVRESVLNIDQFCFSTMLSHGLVTCLLHMILVCTESIKALYYPFSFSKARLWIQIMKELRDGVKLKKVQAQHERQSIEYELTPYEILMEDLRSRRYTLNRIPVRL